MPIEKQFMKKVREKISDSAQKVLLYELLPPSCDIQESCLNAYIECAIELLNDCPQMIDAVNIPDVRKDETSQNNRNQNYISKLEPSLFAHMLRQASHNHLEIILNHCTVCAPWSDQIEWLDLVIKNHEIENLILVGGSSSKIDYPGPSVLEFSNYVQQKYKQEIYYGGITIQTRRCDKKNQDEPIRILTKSQHGFEFFTSQVVYEAKSMKSLLRDYADLCKNNEALPKRIFLSFAPISTRNDLEFLRWLGVIVPETVEKELFKADIGIGWRSIKIASNILDEILNFMSKENINIPLGLNIEHITRHNFELSQKFVEKLGKIYFSS